MENLEEQFLEGLILNTSRLETQASNSVREYSSDPIPDDLFVEIFSGVPFKSIARFCCVSKSLASILGLHDFTELFLTKSLTRPRLLVAVKTKCQLLFYSSPQPHNPDDNSYLESTSYPPTLVSDYRPTYICKPVCGLVLLQRCGANKRPMICNPARGKVLTLPEVPPRKGTNTPSGIYLGYDPIGKQFKVLCLSMKNSLYISPSTHWILRLEYRKWSWRSLKPEFHFKGNRDGVDRDINICINGVLYFEGWLEGWSFVIVWFDVRSEKFGFINKDEDMLLPNSTNPSALFNYKDKLGIHHLVEQKLVLWVLEDAGNHKWSKHIYVLSPLWYEIVTDNLFVGMTSSGEVVYSSNYCVFFNDLERNTVKRVHIQDMQGFAHPTFINTFVDYAENMIFM